MRVPIFPAAPNKAILIDTAGKLLSSNALCNSVRTGISRVVSRLRQTLRLPTVDLSGSIGRALTALV